MKEYKGLAMELTALYNIPTHQSSSFQYEWQEVVEYSSKYGSLVVEKSKREMLSRCLLPMSVKSHHIP